MPYYGFNMTSLVSWSPDRPVPPPDLKALDFQAKHGFNFIRIPTDYRAWTPHHDYLALDERAMEPVDALIAAAHERGLHASLNVHRAPGYCINGNHLERHNLWLDTVAEDGFVHLWETFARRYSSIPSEKLSFDLLNEPPNVGQYGFTRTIHERVMRRTVAAIRAIDPAREIVLNGIGGGHEAIPELADLGVVHSGRGYQPFPISHHQAHWVDVGPWPEPIYPGVLWEGKRWGRAEIAAFYEPWRAVEAGGVRVHIGEFGCHNRTPNDVALRWFADLFSLFREYGWGFALWGFGGAFGIVEHGRPGAVYESLDGYLVDRELLELMKGARA